MSHDARNVQIVGQFTQPSFCQQLPDSGGIANVNSDNAWVIPGLNFLRLSPPPPPPGGPPEDDVEDIVPIDVADDDTFEDILVLDEVGVCEDATVITVDDDGDECGDTNDDIIPQAKKARTDDGTSAVDTGIDDDILSIMCDDNDGDDFLCEEEQKRDWNIESRLRSTCKEKQDSQTSSTPRPKRCRTASFKSHPENYGRHQSSSVHSRLGNRPKHYQKPCFQFSKTGTCFRPACPFHHLNPTAPQDNRMENRHLRQHLNPIPQENRMENRREIYDERHVNQQLQANEQLDHHKVQQQLLLHHMQQTEASLKEHTVHQDQRMYHQMHEFHQNLKDQCQDQLNHTKDAFNEQLCCMSDTHSKMDEHLQVLEGRLNDVESVLKGKEELLAHFQLITRIQEQQLSFFMQAYNGPSKKTSQCNLLSWPSMADLRLLPPLKKPDSHPCCPQSVDIMDQQQSVEGSFPGVCVGNARRPRSASNECPVHMSYSDQHGRQRILSLPPQFTAGNAESKGWYEKQPDNQIEQPPYNVAGNPRIMRILPMRHCNSSVYEYQHERSAMQHTDR